MNAVIHKYSTLPFAWGTADCCTFVAECIEAMIGWNPLSAFRYGSEAEALAFIESQGGMKGTIAHFLGAPASERYEPKDGDVVLTSSINGEMAGVVLNGRIIVRTQQSVVDWPLTRARAVWAV